MFVFWMNTKSCRERAEPARGVTEMRSSTSLSWCHWVSPPKDLRGPDPFPQSVLHTWSGRTPEVRCIAGHAISLPSLNLWSCFLLAYFLWSCFVYFALSTEFLPLKTSLNLGHGQAVLSGWDDSSVQEGTSARDSECVLGSGRGGGPLCRPVAVLRPVLGAEGLVMCVRGRLWPREL